MKKRRFTRAQMVTILREADRGTVADSRASTRSTNSEWDERLSLAAIRRRHTYEGNKGRGVVEWLVWASA